MISQPKNAGQVEDARKPPRFDVLRVAPDGAGLAAGRAEPGSRVRLRSGTTTLVEVDAGPSGEFAAHFRVEPDEAPNVLALEAGAAGDMLRSEQHVLLLPPAPDRRAEPSALSEAVAEAEGWSAAAGRPLVNEGMQSEGEPPENRLATAAILEPGATPRVVPALDPEVPTTKLHLTSIDYGENGSVRLGGSAPAGSRLRVYVDGNHSGDWIADKGGRWDASLEDLQQGVYRIRVDALGKDGAVTSRVETPFQRTFPPANRETGTVTVQPGNNLWTIAQTRYGSGMRYTRIFTANAALIEDPDLIYPGQIFVLPNSERSTGGPKARP